VNASNVTNSDISPALVCWRNVQQKVQWFMGHTCVMHMQYIYIYGICASYRYNRNFVGMK
jgi:hypothetical protein